MRQPIGTKVNARASGRFPYAAYYVIREGYILIMAFGHTSRKPGYWRSRLKR